MVSEPRRLFWQGHRSERSPPHGKRFSRRELLFYVFCSSFGRRALLSGGKDEARDPLLMTGNLLRWAWETPGIVMRNSAKRTNDKTCPRRATRKSRWKAGRVVAVPLSVTENPEHTRNPVKLTGRKAWKILSGLGQLPARRRYNLFALELQVTGNPKKLKGRQADSILSEGNGRRKISGEAD